MLEERTSWFPSAAPPHLALCDSVTLCAHNVSVLRTSPARLHSSSGTSFRTVCPTNNPPRPAATAPRSAPPSPPTSSRRRRPLAGGGGRGSGGRCFRPAALPAAMAAGGSDPRAADVEEDASQLVFPKGANRTGPGRGGEGPVGAGWKLAAACGSGAASPVTGTQSPGDDKSYMRLKNPRWLKYGCSYVERYAYRNKN